MKIPRAKEVLSSITSVMMSELSVLSLCSFQSASKRAWLNRTSCIDSALKIHRNRKNEGGKKKTKKNQNHEQTDAFPGKP